MKLLNIITARAVWLFDLRELNPKGIKSKINIITWLKEKYSFEVYPKSLDDMSQDNSFVLKRGTFRNSEKNIVNIDLNIHTDGIIADSSSSTHDSEEFLHNALSSCSEDLGLYYEPSMVIHKLLLSEFNFYSENNLIGLNEKLSRFIDKLTSYLPEKINAGFETTGINFTPHLNSPSPPISKFTIERKINTHPSENKYYSISPFHTDMHIELTNEFESIFMK